MKTKIKIALSLLFSLVYTFANAQVSTYKDALKNANYKSYATDVSRDGIPDVLLIAEQKIVMVPIDDDLIMGNFRLDVYACKQFSP